MTLNYLLVSEGSDDRMLHKPIEWLLDQHCGVPYAGQWANPAALSDNSRKLEVRLRQVMHYFPCDLAFVHRDTDTFSYDVRAAEIMAAAVSSGYPTPIVCAIPVRMTEAWFLFDELAIRKAAGNPRSSEQLNLPSFAEVQRRADPKEILTEKLILASGLSGRKLKNFNIQLGEKKSLVSVYIDDYSPLRVQQSFAQLENDLILVLANNNWSK